MTGEERKVYNKKYREAHCAYFANYARENWSKTYYKDHEKMKAYRRKNSEEYRRAKGILPKGGSNHWNWKGGPRKCKCGCFLKNRSKSTRMCIECRKIYLSKKMTGKNNPSWNGGFTSFRKSLHGSSQYRQWRLNIFKRDNYTCRECFKRGGYLEAHHIKRIIIIIREAIPNYKDLRGFQIKNRLIEYEPLWDLNNGLTLCLNCHKKECKKDKKIIMKYFNQKN